MNHVIARRAHRVLAVSLVTLAFASGCTAAADGEAREGDTEKTDTVASALEGACTSERAATMEEAVKASAAAARPGDTVLLSPACASLDMFRDYGHRGDEFAAAVRAL